jgi:hypothetical protein
MQTPRAITLTRGSRNYRQAYKNIIEMMVKMEISVELPFVSRAIKHDSLGLACYYGKDEAMQVILNISDSSGASVSKTLSTVSGIDAALTAIDCGFSEAIDTIVPRMMARLDVTNYNLLVSAVHHQPDLIPRVYSHFERAGRGPELLSYIDPWGATAFDLAMEYGYLDLAQFLLDKGATYDVYRLKGDHTIDDGEQSTLASVLPRMKPIRFLMELTPKPRLIVTNTGLNVFHILASDESLVSKFPQYQHGLFCIQRNLTLCSDYCWSSRVPQYARVLLQDGPLSYSRKRRLSRSNTFPSCKPSLLRNRGRFSPRARCGYKCSLYGRSHAFRSPPFPRRRGGVT